MATYDVKIQDVTFTNNYSFAVDGFRGRRVIPQRREVRVDLPGVNGTVPYIGSFDPSQFAIDVWVTGDLPGVPPSPAQLEKNLDTLMGALFQKQLLKFEWLHPDGTWRQAYVRLLSGVTPEIDHNQLFARFTLLFENPGCFWRGTAEQSFTSKVFNTEVSPTMLANWTGVADDGRLSIVGPIANPVFKIESQSVGYVGTVADGQTLVIDNDKMTATLAGASVMPNMNYSGSRFFELTPKAKATLTGTATTTATQWTLTGLPAYS